MTGHLDDFVARGLSPAAPITAERDVRVGSGDVWGVVVEPGHLTNVHPFCQRNDVEVWPGPGGRDHVLYYSGLHYQRDVLDWREGVGFDLALGPPSGKIAIARWSIDPTGPDSCRLAIEVTSFVRDDADPESRRRYESEVIGRAIPPYLDSVVRGVAHFSETGNPVTRNQFGPHDIYSPAAN